MTEICPGCLVEFDAVDGPTHRFISASSACWRQYGEFLATGSGHLLAVEAYAAQHPGVETPQAIQSVAVHLVALDAVLNQGVDQALLVEVRTRAVEAGRSGAVTYAWMDPRPRDWAYALSDVIRGCDFRSWVLDVRDRWWSLHGDKLSAWTLEVIRGV